MEKGYVLQFITACLSHHLVGRASETGSRGWRSYSSPIMPSFMSRNIEVIALVNQRSEPGGGVLPGILGGDVQSASQNPTLFKTKMGKINTLFRTKLARKPYPFGQHISI